MILVIEIVFAVVLLGLAVALALLWRRLIRERAHLSQTVRRVIAAQENERKRVARELHDDTAQSLLAIMHQIDDLTAGSATPIPDNARFKLARLYSLAQVSHQAVRRYARDLRPAILDDLGLGPAIEWLADNLEMEKGIDVRVHIDDLDPPPHHDTQLVLFRIAQEAISNIAKHSGASRMSITLNAAGGRLRMVISDDGRGFEVSPRPPVSGRTGELGLVGMRERAQLVGGTFSVRSAPRAGTTVSVEVPAGSL